MCSLEGAEKDILVWASLVEWLLWMYKALTLGSVLNTETKGKKEGGGGVRGVGE